MQPPWLSIVALHLRVWDLLVVGKWSSVGGLGGLPEIVHEAEIAIFHWRGCKT